MKLKIAFYAHGQVKSVYVDDETNEFTVGSNQIYKGASTFIQAALSLIKQWPDKIVADDAQMRDIHYKIAYDDGVTTKQITAEGKFPEDFYKLSNLIFSYENPILYKIQQKAMQPIVKEGR